MATRQTIQRRRKTKLEQLNRELLIWKNQLADNIHSAKRIVAIKQEISDIENHKVNFCY